MEDDNVVRKLQMYNTVINHCENVWNTPQNVNYKVQIKYRPLEEAKAMFLVEREDDRSLKMFKILMDKQIPEAYGWYMKISMFMAEPNMKEMYECAEKGRDLGDLYSTAWMLRNGYLRPYEDYNEIAIKTTVIKLLKQSVVKDNNTCSKLMLGAIYNTIEHRDICTYWYNEAMKDGWPISF